MAKRLKTTDGQMTTYNHATVGATRKALAKASVKAIAPTNTDQGRGERRLRRRRWCSDGLAVTRTNEDAPRRAVRRRRNGTYEEA